MSVFILPILGGLLIGLSATLLLWLNGRIAGISGITDALMSARNFAETGWRAAFVVGLILGPVLLSLFGFHAIGKPVASTSSLALAGLLVGFGTVLGGGCTSGHGVCGIARLSMRSLVATLVFVIMAAMTVFVVRHAL